MKLFAAVGYRTYCDYVAYIEIKSHTFAGLTSRSEHLLEDVTYIT